MSNLKGKVAIVTGASKGIGAAIAERLAADGAAVVVNYSRSAKEGDAVIGRIKSAGGEAIAVQADVSKPEQIERLFAATKEKFGHVDILVNNAGVYEFKGLDSITPEHIDKHFDLNVKGLLLATQAAVRAFPPEGGVVVNISSGAALTPLSQGSVYSATKAAVDTITRALAVELGAKKIRIVGVAPGLTTTEGTTGMDEQAVGYFITRTPLGRVGEPKDIAGAVSFVVSEDGAWITGETLQVGGGLKL